MQGEIPRAKEFYNNANERRLCPKAMLPSLFAEFAMRGGADNKLNIKKMFNRFLPGDNTVPNTDPVQQFSTRRLVVSMTEPDGIASCPGVSEMSGGRPGDVRWMSGGCPPDVRWQRRGEEIREEERREDLSRGEEKRVERRAPAQPLFRFFSACSLVSAFQDGHKAIEFNDPGRYYVQGRVKSGVMTSLPNIALQVGV